MLFALFETLLVLLFSFFCMTAQAETPAKTPLYEAFITGLRQEEEQRAREKQSVEVQVEPLAEASPVIPPPVNQKAPDEADPAATSKNYLSLLMVFADNDPETALSFFDEHQNVFTWEDLIVARRLIDILERRENEKRMQDNLYSSKQNGSATQVHVTDIFENIDGDGTSEKLSNEEIKLAQQTALKNEARTRLIWSSMGLGLLALAVYFLRHHHKQIIGFIAALPAQVRLPKKLKIAIAAYILWILLLVFTNSFLFYGLFWWDNDYVERFWLLATLPPTFALVAYGLYAWAMNPEKVRDTTSMAGTTVPPSIAATPWKPDRKFYMNRTATLLWLTISITIVELPFFTLLEMSPGKMSNFVFAGILLLTPLVFSKPLGFWRKVVCWTIGMAAFIFPVSVIAAVLAGIVGDIMTLMASAGPGPQEEVSASGLIAGLSGFLSGTMMVYLPSLSLGIYAVKKTQDYWRQKLSP